MSVVTIYKWFAFRVPMTVVRQPRRLITLRWWDSYMHQLLEIMACCCEAPSHYLNKCWLIITGTLTNKLQWNLNQYTNIFIGENAFENVVCAISAILSLPKGVMRPAHLEWREFIFYRSQSSALDLNLRTAGDDGSSVALSTSFQATYGFGMISLWRHNMAAMARVSLVERFHY